MTFYQEMNLVNLSYSPNLSEIFWSSNDTQNNDFSSNNQVNEDATTSSSSNKVQDVKNFRESYFYHFSQQQYFEQSNESNTNTDPIIKPEEYPIISPDVSKTLNKKKRKRSDKRKVLLEKGGRKTKATGKTFTKEAVEKSNIQVKSFTRYDEPLKNLKSYASKLEISDKIKEYEKGKPKWGYINDFLKKFREIFTTDAKKSTNNHYIGKTIIKIFQDICSGEYYMKSQEKTRKQKPRKNETTSTSTDNEIKNKVKNIRNSKKTNKFDCKTYINEEDFLSHFSDYRSKVILQKTYQDIVEKFVTSKNFKTLYEILENNQDKDYMKHYDYISSNLVDYLEEKKTDIKSKK